jgi:hypothetical protein
MHRRTAALLFALAASSPALAQNITPTIVIESGTSLPGGITFFGPTVFDPQEMDIAYDGSTLAFITNGRLWRWDAGVIRLAAEPFATTPPVGDILRNVSTLLGTLRPHAGTVPFFANVEFNTPFRRTNNVFAHTIASGLSALVREELDPLPPPAGGALAFNRPWAVGDLRTTLFEGFTPPSSGAGLYARNRLGAFVRIAGPGFPPIPQGVVANWSSDALLAARGDLAAFVAQSSVSGYFPLVVSNAVSGASSVAFDSDAAPSIGLSTQFFSFTQNLSVDEDGRAAFIASSFEAGQFTAAVAAAGAGRPVAPIARSGNPIPGSTRLFTNNSNDYRAVSTDDDIVGFWHQSGPLVGIYTHANATLSRVVDTTMTIHGRQPQFLVATPGMIGAGRAAFAAFFGNDPVTQLPQWGIYIADAGTPACPGDWNADGVIDFNDLLAFLNDYNAQAPRADVNADGVIDFNDFLAFLNLYNQPC